MLIEIRKIDVRKKFHTGQVFEFAITTGNLSLI